jgi:hypothetical protein
MEREAAALPARVPERDLWPEVAHGIGAPIFSSASVEETASQLGATEPPVLESAAVSTNVPPLFEDEPQLQMGDEPPLPTDEPSLPTQDPTLVTDDPSLSTGQPILLTSEPSQPLDEPPLQTIERSVPAGEPAPPSAEALVPTIAPAPEVSARRGKRWTPVWMGMAAAALVMVSAGTTFLLTVRWLGPARTPYVVTNTANRQLSPSVTRPADRGKVAPSGRPPVASDSSATTSQSGVPSASLAVATTRPAQVARPPEEAVYDKEINMLQTMTRRRKSELEPSTAAVIEKNLRIIDSNIAQIRAALQKDPGNSLLDDQVSRALDMKVELLRRVAMLRSNT